MYRADDALLHLNWAREAEKNGDFLRARVEHLKCVESWKQANQIGGFEAEFQSATKEYEDFVKRDPIFAKLLSSLLPIIKSNPGILQSAIYKHVQEMDRGDISYALYFAAKQGKISRTKKGRSYELRIGQVENLSQESYGNKQSKGSPQGLLGKILQKIGF